MKRCLPWLCLLLLMLPDALPAQDHVAYRIPEGTAGTQDFGGSLGMDFVVSSDITVTELGAFDDLSDGLRLPITVELWSRDDNGTPEDFVDDTGLEVLATLEFTPEDPGELDGGSRFKALAQGVTLTPGAYAIVAWGYGAAERNGNGTTSFGTVADVPHLVFVGLSHWGDAGAYPANTDGGPANRYGAGTFRFEAPILDTDGDGLDDRVEETLFGDLSETSATDFDGDGLSNGDELAGGTDPTQGDTDGDGLDDSVETGTGSFVSTEDTGTSPLLADTDGDGLGDGEEIGAHGTDPHAPDSDGDGASDGEEIVLGFDPFDENSRPDAKEVAYVVEAGTVGNQDFGGSLGMDFIVNVPLEIFELGVFDSGGDGVKQPLTAEIWSRDDGGTPEESSDDAEGELLAQVAFAPEDPGFLIGGSRFKPLETVLSLAPGAYTVVGRGYGSEERNGNLGIGALPLSTAETGELTFVGGGRYGADGWPITPDLGPANRYAAGTFTFGRVQTDSDGDGFEDTIELAVGSDPQDVASTPPADAVFLVASTYWDRPEAWSDGSAPSEGKHYYVIGGVVNRLLIPGGAEGSAVFAGDSLTVTGESAELVFGPESSDAVVPSLVLENGGRVVHGVAGERRSLGGTVRVEGHGLLQLAPDGRVLELLATLTGNGTVSLRHAVSAEMKGRLVLGRANPDFEGSWQVVNAVLHAAVVDALGSGDVIIEGGLLDADYNINSPRALLQLVNEASVVKLDRDHVFGTFLLGTIDVGAAIGAGTYTRDDLITNVDPALESNFTDDGGSISIGGDLDGDGLLDAWEVEVFGNTDQDGSADGDMDGLTNLEEFGTGSDPTKEDTDEDGLDDAEERARGTDPRLADTDGDGLTDPEEAETNPTVADTDGDGLSDGVEVLETLTDPNDRDTDADGSSDGEEVGLGTDPLDAGSVAATVAYVVEEATTGNQDFGGSLGMDFVVAEPIDVVALGAFDSGSDGIASDITVELWSRNDGGTPEVFDDDSGIERLATAVFTSADPGSLRGGSRFKDLAEPLHLSPGAYAIVAYGYGAGDSNGNLGGAPDLPLSLAETTLIRFVGNGHFGDAGAYPDIQDLGPANRYAAGTFAFLKAGGAVEPGQGPSILSVTHLGGSVTLTWSAQSGQAVAVERSTDLQAWELMETVMPQGEIGTYTDLEAAAKALWYRLGYEQ